MAADMEVDLGDDLDTYRGYVLWCTYGFMCMLLSSICACQ
jgi:hypothetical protein